MLEVKLSHLPVLLLLWLWSDRCETSQGKTKHSWYLLSGPVEREERGSFPGPRDVLGVPPSLKNTVKGVPDVVFLTSNMNKIYFRRILLGSLRCSPRPLVGW